jgi:hypothetical protein
MNGKWTDDRLDDLNQKVGEGFNRVEGGQQALRAETKTEFTALRGEMKDLRGEMKGEMTALRGEMNAHFERIDARFERIDARFESLQRIIVYGALTLSAAYMAGFAALIGS